MTTQILHKGKGDPESTSSQQGGSIVAADSAQWREGPLPEGMQQFLRAISGRGALPEDYVRQLVEELRQGLRDEAGTVTAGGAVAINYTNYWVTLYHYMTGKAEKCMITNMLAAYERRDRNGRRIYRLTPPENPLIGEGQFPCFLNPDYEDYYNKNLNVLNPTNPCVHRSSTNLQRRMHMEKRHPREWDEIVTVFPEIGKNSSLLAAANAGQDVQPVPQFMHLSDNYDPRDPNAAPIPVPDDAPIVVEQVEAKPKKG